MLNSIKYVIYSIRNISFNTKLKFAMTPIGCDSIFHKRWVKLFLAIKHLENTDRYVLIAINGSAMFFIIGLNLLSIIAIRKSSQLKNKLCYFLILVQSSFDMLVGVLGVPLILACMILTAFYDEVRCDTIIMFVLLIILISSLSTVALISMTLERYFGVVHPYFYEAQVTKRKVLIFVVVLSMINLSLVASSIFSTFIVKHSSPSYISIMFAITAYVYLRIYLVVRKIHKTEKVSAHIQGEEQQCRRRRLLQEIKHAKPCFVVLLCFGISLLPGALGQIFIGPKTSKAGALVVWSITLMNFNSIFNSIIFFWGKTMLRKEAKKVLKSLYSREALN